MQKKKRVQVNHQPLLLTDGSNNNGFSDKKVPEASQTILFEENKMLKSFIKDDQFILLGPQDKFSSANVVPYRMRIPIKKDTKPINENKEVNIFFFDLGAYITCFYVKFM